MKHTVQVVFGKEQVKKWFAGESLAADDKALYVKEYQFESEKEKQAFIHGLNEAVGFVEFCIPELE